MPFSDGYSKYITTKNLDFKDEDEGRKHPDPVREFLIYTERPVIDFGLQEDQSLIQLQRISESYSPVKQRSRIQPAVTKNLIKNTADWKATLASSPQSTKIGSPLKTPLKTSKAPEEFKSSVRIPQLYLFDLSR